jgi:hypothetical protein
MYRGVWELFDAPIYVRDYAPLPTVALQLRDSIRVWALLETRVGRIRGPHLPDVIDIKTHPDRPPILFMRLPEGQVLMDHVESHGPLKGTETARVVTHVASALTTYRAAGLPHRAPTPDRVWLGVGGEAVLLGAGDALYRDMLSVRKGPRPVKLMWHIPPEAFGANGSDATSGSQAAVLPSDAGAPPRIGTALEDDPRAEVYTLACLAYFTLNGYHPFFVSQADTTEGIQATIRDEPLGLRDYDENSEVWRVLRRGLSRDPEARHETPAEFAEAFREAVTLSATTPSQQLALSRDDGTSAPLVIYEPSATKTARISIWALGILAAIMTAGVIVMLAHERFQERTLVVTSNPPGILVGEEIGHIRRPLGATPVFLEGRDLATPLRIFAIGPAGDEGPSSELIPSRGRDLGECHQLNVDLEFNPPDLASDDGDPD